MLLAVYFPIIWLRLCWLQRNYTEKNCNVGTWYWSVYVFVWIYLWSNFGERDVKGHPTLPPTWFKPSNLGITVWWSTTVLVPVACSNPNEWEHLLIVFYYRGQRWKGILFSYTSFVKLCGENTYKLSIFLITKLFWYFLAIES